MIIIVSRHPAMIEFMVRCLSQGGDYFIYENEALLQNYPAGDEVEVTRIPIFRGNVTAEDVAGEIVYGILPLNLAAEASEVRTVAFQGDPPRGREYSLEDMKAAGASIQAFKVEKA